LVVLTGRRRVGKTETANEFQKKSNKNILMLKFTGNINMNNKESLRECNYQLEQFIKNINKDFHLDISIDKNQPKNWNSFHHKLEQLVLFSEKHFLNKDVKLVLFFDEINWFTKDRTFLTELGQLYNQTLCNSKNTMTLIAGSSAGWIRKKILEDKKVLYGRVNKVIEIKPFSLLEIKQYCQMNNPNINMEDVITYYLAFGGIIKYYEKIDFRRLPIENFQDKNFQNYIMLEKEQIFDSMFESGLHKEIMQLLSTSKNVNENGLRTNLIKLSEKFGEHRTKLIDDLNDLESCRFIVKQKNKNQIHFMLNDPFSYFINYWVSNNYLFTNNNYYNTWKGNAFEIMLFNILNNNDSLTKEILDAAAINVNDKQIFLNWFIREGKNKIVSQLDLLIKSNSYGIKNNEALYRKHTILELKNYDDTWNITKKELDEIIKKATNYNFYNNTGDNIQTNILIVTMKDVNISEEVLKTLKFPISFVSINDFIK